MKKTMTVAATLAAGLLLSSCGSSTATGPLAPSVAPAAAETAATNNVPTPTAPSRSDRGNLIKDVGVAASSSIDGEEIVSFVVSSIEVDPVCSGALAEPAQNGHFVVMSLEAQTTAALAKDVNPQFSFSSGNWKVIAENGTTQNQFASSQASFSCLDDAERFPISMGPAEKATGKIVLDVVSPSGTLVLHSGSGAGWEWSYAAK